MNKVQQDIYDLVNDWCDVQYGEIPDMNRRYLMDKLLAHNKKLIKEYTEWHKKYAIQRDEHIDEFLGK